MEEDLYWQRYASRFRVLDSVLKEKPVKSPDMAICIPAYAEDRLLFTLESLLLSKWTGKMVEVLILFNQDDRMSELEKQIHLESWQQAQQWTSFHATEEMNFIPIWLEKLEIPKWGVGWARKIVMDEAARRLNQQGLIICLDADCVVQENYLEEIENYFFAHQTIDAISIYVEHKLDELSKEKRDAVIAYELHLRYLVHAQRWTGYPFAFQTFGSAMAVRRSAYLLQGGMNTRQAGEDFYFLQKFIEIGKLAELRTTSVYPSARHSLRVPFGTGKAMVQIATEKKEWGTTAFETFILIKPLFSNLHLLHQKLIAGKASEVYNTLSLDDRLITYLDNIGFIKECLSIHQHTSGYEAFRRRFFRYFNGIRMIHYMHFMRDHFFPDIDPAKASADLSDVMEWKIPSPASQEVYLNWLRKEDREPT